MSLLARCLLAIGLILFPTLAFSLGGNGVFDWFPGFLPPRPTNRSALTLSSEMGECARALSIFSIWRESSGQKLLRLAAEPNSRIPELVDLADKVFESQHVKTEKRPDFGHRILSEESGAMPNRLAWQLEQVDERIEVYYSPAVLRVGPSGSQAFVLKTPEYFHVYLSHQFASTGSLNYLDKHEIVHALLLALEDDGVDLGLYSPVFLGAEKPISFQEILTYAVTLRELGFELSEYVETPNSKQAKRILRELELLLNSYGSILSSIHQVTSIAVNALRDLKSEGLIEIHPDGYEMSLNPLGSLAVRSNQIGSVNRSSLRDSLRQRLEVLQALTGGLIGELNKIKRELRDDQTRNGGRLEWSLLDRLQTPIRRVTIYNVSFQSLREPIPDPKLRIDRYVEEFLSGLRDPGLSGDLDVRRGNQSQPLAEGVTDEIREYVEQIGPFVISEYLMSEYPQSFDEVWNGWQKKSSDPLNWLMCGSNQRLANILGQRFPGLKFDVIGRNYKYVPDDGIYGELNHFLISVRGTNSVIDFVYRQIYFQNDRINLPSGFFDKLPRVFVGSDALHDKIFYQQGYSRYGR